MRLAQRVLIVDHLAILPVASDDDATRRISSQRGGGGGGNAQQEARGQISRRGEQKNRSLSRLALQTRRRGTRRRTRFDRKQENRERVLPLSQWFT